MNKLGFLSALIGLMVSACSLSGPTPEPSYIDLIGNRAAVDGYWIVERKVAPTYPITAARNGITGCVEFSLLIDTDGKPKNVSVIKSFPGNTFNKKAYDAIRKWYWVPASSNKANTPVMTTVQLDFSTPEPANIDEAREACIRREK